MLRRQTGLNFLSVHLQLSSDRSRIALLKALQNFLVLGVDFRLMLKQVIDRNLNLIGRQTQHRRDPISRPSGTKVLQNGIDCNSSAFDLRAITLVNNAGRLHKSAFTS